MLNIKVILVILLAISLSFTAQAQEANTLGRTVLKISPVEFGRAEFKLGVEHFFANRKSSISFMPSAILKESLQETKKRWLTAAQYRFYLSHINKADRNTLFGFENYAFYTGIFGLYQSYKKDYSREYYDDLTDTYRSGDFHKEVTAQEGGLILGLQISITKRIIVDLNLGGSIRNNKLEDNFDYEQPNYYYYEDYSVFEPEYKGVKPVIGFMIGIVL